MWWIGIGLAVTGSVLVHALLTRAAPKQNTVILAVIGGLVTGLPLIIWAWWMFGPLSTDFLSAVLIYAAICELYLFLFTLALSSVSANVLVRLIAGPQDRDELHSSYDSRIM